MKPLCLKISETLRIPENIVLGEWPPAPNDPPELTADVKRLYSELGWKPSIGLDQGLEETIRWWKENLAQVQA